MRVYGGVDFLTSALAGSEGTALRLCRFNRRRKSPGTQWIGGWVRPRAGLDAVQKRKFLILSGLELRPLDRLTRSQSLRYPGSLQNFVLNKNMS
jgi:hypothetical protein